VANYITWKHISTTWPKLVANARNVRLGLALDGVNPFGDLCNCHSTWPMVLLNSNLPPWLVTKEIIFHVIINHPWEGVMHI
jgi:hypothetical protein